MQDKVQKVADELGYQVNRVASVLKSGRNNVIAMLVPDLADPFFASSIKGGRILPGNDGYEMIIANSNDDIEMERKRLDVPSVLVPNGSSRRSLHR